jgi:hypothetical protein
MLTDWISLGTYWWLILGCIAAVSLAILTVQIIRVWEENDAANKDAQTQPTCQIGDCTRPAANTYVRDHIGLLRVCDMHATRIQRWTEPPIYDQDLDQAGDLAKWNKEMDAS